MLTAAASVVVAGIVATGNADAAVGTSVYASPTGTGTACTQTSPCSVQQAQSKVRGLTATMTADIAIVLANGTYSLTAPISLTQQDSGTNGHKVLWQAAAGARPVLSGGVPITGWTRTAAGSSIWSAPAPSGLATRQLYASGTRIPRATGTLGSGPLTGVSLNQNIAGGYTASNSTMSTWRNPSNIEFVYPNGNGRWTEPRCGVNTISGTTIMMRQPCWDNAHTLSTPLAPDCESPSGGFPGIKTSKPSRIENAYELLTPGHWYFDQTARTIYYDAQATENPSTMSFVAPALQQLMTSTGTATQPVHDITFQGLEFAYATWMQPSGNEGFAEMQANMTVTGVGGSNTQGLCGYAPGGTCPFASWTRQPAAVDLAGTWRVSFLNNKFHHLGGAGLGLYHGASSDLIQGNEITDVSGNGMVLGGLDDQQPLDNIAQGRTATQSSTGYGAPASRAVDGNTDGAFPNGSVSHTNSQANAWWQVDLGSVLPVNLVSIHNRVDCCADRLKDYWVFVSSTPFNTALTPTQQAAQPGVWSSHQTTQAGNPTAIPSNTVGRYVMVRLAGTGYLSLAEVKVSSLVLSGNTISNNYVHHTGVEYSGAIGIFAGYAQFTTITHNQVSDLPYTGISFGWGGWHTNTVTPTANVSINTDNTISNNLITNVMGVRHDGGAIYTNGSQGTSFAHGMVLRGNVTFGNKDTHHAYYADEGSAWVTNDRNVQYGDLGHFNGGCSALGPTIVTNSYKTGALNIFACTNVGAPSQFVTGGGIHGIAQNPVPSQLDHSLLREAGLEAPYAAMTTTVAPRVAYASQADNGSQLISGTGFTPTSTVRIGSQLSPAVTYLSPTHLIATVPAGASGHTTVTTSAGTSQTSENDVVLKPSIAVGKTATQSSTWGGTMVAGKAVDGNTDGAFSHGGMSSTYSQANAWWRVDLGAGTQLNSINLFRQTNCCGDRLSDYWVFVSNTPFDTTLTPTQQAAQAGVWSSHQTTQAGSPTTIPASTTGRYVMVQLSGTNYLSLAEVWII